MPRSSGVYSAPPGTTASASAVIESAKYNAFVNDLVSDANAPRPVIAGGTGATTEDGALTSLGGTTVGKDVFRSASKAAARSAIGAELPAGAVMHFVMTTAPSGWLKANGAAVSRTTYADLFAAIGTSFGAGDGSTTFNLPDMRGEFLRAWDDGRGIDPSRAMGSAQAAAMLDHTHAVSGTTGANGAHPHNAIVAAGAGSSTTLQTTPGAPTPNGSVIQSVPDHTHPFSATSSSPSAGAGTETRPRNVALLACIKY